MTPEEHDAIVTIWRAIVAIVARTERQLLDQVEEAGIPAHWFGVLRLLLRADNHRLPMSKLAREMSFTSGGFTKLAYRIRRAGLIDRHNSDGDRRVVYATLTTDGIAAAVAGERAYLAALTKQVLGAVSAAELSSAWRTLRTLSAPNESAPNTSTRKESAPDDRRDDRPR